MHHRHGCYLANKFKADLSLCYLPNDVFSLIMTLTSTPPGMLGSLPLQYFGWGDISGNISPLLLRTWGYSRSVLVVFAQRQHLLMYFIYCFARKSKICHRIDPHLTEGACNKKSSKLAPQNLPKYANVPHRDHKTERFGPSQIPSPVGEEHPRPTLTPFVASSPQL